MVLDTYEPPAVICECALDGGVTLPRIGLVIVTGEDRVDGELPRQRRDGVRSMIVQHDQRAAVAPQFCVQFDDCAVDELDAPVGAQSGGEQPVENRAVEDEGAVDPAARGKRRRQRRVVVKTQVAAEPDQAGVVGHASAVRPSVRRRDALTRVASAAVYNRSHAE